MSTTSTRTRTAKAGAATTTIAWDITVEAAHQLPGLRLALAMWFLFSALFRTVIACYLALLSLSLLSPSPSLALPAVYVVPILPCNSHFSH